MLLCLSTWVLDWGTTCQLLIVFSLQLHPLNYCREVKVWLRSGDKCELVIVKVRARQSRINGSQLNVSINECVCVFLK